MKEQNGSRPEGREEQSGEPGERHGKRCYASYPGKEKFSFDPMKDLNLPESYEEVVSRFKRLQVIRAMEALN